MSDVNLSMKVFGWYMVLGTGAGFLFAPHIITDITGMQLGPDTWIRLVGALAGIIGFYYLTAVKHGYTEIFSASVYGRLVAVLTMIFRVVSGKGSSVFLVFVLLPNLSILGLWSSQEKRELVIRKCL